MTKSYAVASGITLFGLADLRRVNQSVTRGGIKIRRETRLVSKIHHFMSRGTSHGW